MILLDYGVTYQGAGHWLEAGEVRTNRVNGQTMGCWYQMGQISLFAQYLEHLVAKIDFYADQIYKDNTWL